MKVFLLTYQNISLVKSTMRYDIVNNFVVLCTICFVIVLLGRCVCIF